MLPNVTLVQVTRDDVNHIGMWLQDAEINGAWYGADDNGEPLHIGYVPRRMVEATNSEWEEVFAREDRHIFSLLTGDGEHIGEAQMVIEAPLKQAQLFILIGRKDMWYQGYGTAGFLQILDLAFHVYDLHRAWVDIPEYNLPAIHMCERIGFVLEGCLRGTHPKDGEWYDSLTMGLLSDEYARRRARLTEKRGELPLWSGLRFMPLVADESTHRLHSSGRGAEQMSSMFDRNF
jgi:RimJ/RimL family protein N-acetyltransferase